MIHLRSVEYLRFKANTHDEYPFNTKLAKGFEKLIFDSTITLFVGENGSGKSTLLEAIAAAIGAITAGSESVEFDEEFEAVRNLAKCFKLIWSFKNKKGFFLRAEDYISYTKKLSQIRSDMKKAIDEVDDTYAGKSNYTKNLAKMPYVGSLNEMKSMYNGNLEDRSHGESYLTFFKARLKPGVLYLLDEPETPLSPMNQLTFIALIKEMVEQDCQFIIATHSPIIMAYPNASIYDFDELPLQQVNYNDLEHVRFMKAFLNDPERYLRHL